MTHSTTAQPLAIGTLLALTAAALLPTVAAAQDEDSFDRTPADCITVASIDRTDVVDDQTILFYMRGKKIFRNYLPKRCPGLKVNDRFSYEVRGGRLCDIDTVTVLEQWGTRLSNGFTCQLGDFHPIPAEEADELQLDEDGHRKNRDAVKVEKAQLPDGAERSEAPGNTNDSDDSDDADDAKEAAPDGASE